MEDVFHGADVIASPCHSNLSNITLTDAEEMRSTTSVKSEKTRDVVSKMMVNKIPIVLKEASVDSTDDEERDEFIVTPLKRKPKTLKDDMPVTMMKTSQTLTGLGLTHLMLYQFRKAPSSQCQLNQNEESTHLFTLYGIPLKEMTL